MSNRNFFGVDNAKKQIDERSRNRKRYMSREIHFLEVRNVKWPYIIVHRNMRKSLS